MINRNLDGREYFVKPEKIDELLAAQPQEKTGKVLRQSVCKLLFPDEVKVHFQPPLILHHEFIPQNNRYEFGHLLGKGTASEVYFATDTKMNRPVAIKILRPISERDTKEDKLILEEMQRMMQREARGLAKLEGSFLTRIYDFYITETGEIVLVMEYFDESMPTLETLLAEEGSVSVNHALQILDQMAEHLESLFLQFRFRYRDFKPANIFIQKDTWQVRMGDIGLSSIASPGQSGGTAYYMPPEYWVQEDSTQMQSEVFSFALLFCEMVTGQPLLKPVVDQARGILVIEDDLLAGKHLQLMDWEGIFEKLSILGDEQSKRSAIRAILSQALDPNMEVRQKSVISFMAELRAALTMPRSANMERSIA